MSITICKNTCIGGYNVVINGLRVSTFDTQVAAKAHARELWLAYAKMCRK